ncbi:MAG: STAS domain-containing protein, partial [candidate division Zixibacteria bacterium]|nr:STAS domain-containing protein [candidate division Zixibacteria bacterium]
QSGDVTILELSGDATDVSDSVSLRERVRKLTEEGKTKLVANLENVGLMNSLGLGMLIASLSTVRNRGGDLKLANITDRIKSVLVITRLVTVFDCYDSVNEAVRSFEK